MTLTTVLTQSRKPGTSDANWRTIDPAFAQGFRDRLEDVRELVDRAEAEEKIAALSALIGKAQAVLVSHLPPDGISAHAAISELLGILDGPEQRAAQMGVTASEKASVAKIDDPAEAAFWLFDARVKGYAEWTGRPQSMRDAFKVLFRIALRTTPPIEA